MQAISRSFLFWKERNRGALAVGKRQHRRIVTLERRKIASLNTRNVRSSAIRTTSIDEVCVVTLWSLSDSSHGHSVQARIRHLNPQLALQSWQRCCEDRGGSQEELKELSDITFIRHEAQPIRLNSLQSSAESRLYDQWRNPALANATTNRESTQFSKKSITRIHNRLILISRKAVVFYLAGVRYLVDIEDVVNTSTERPIVHVKHSFN